MRLLPSLLALATTAFAHPLGAQSRGELSAYAVMIQTPPGGLPPILSNAMFGVPMHAPDVALRVGHISINGTGVNMFGATLGIPAGPRATIGLTAGYEQCGGTIGCGAHTVAGARVEGRLSSTQLGAGTDARFTIGLNGELGIAHPRSDPIVSLTGGVPFAIVVGGPGLKVAPFLTPALGWARDYGDVRGATRFLLGGGVALMSAQNGISANFGFQKVLIDGGDVMFGVNLVFGFR